MPVMMPIVKWPFPAIGATFRLERAQHLAHSGPEPDDHGLEDMVVLNVDCVNRNFSRCVSIADVPRYACELMRTFGMNFEQTLGCSDDADKSAVFQLQGVAVSQVCRLLQIEEKRRPAVRPHGRAPAIAGRAIQCDRVGRFSGPDLGFPDGSMCALHG